MHFYFKEYVIKIKEIKLTNLIRNQFNAQKYEFFGIYLLLQIL